MSKAIVIIRTSTSRQEVETQKKEVVEYANSFGYSPDDIIVIGGEGASAIKLDDEYMNNMEEVKHTIETKDINCVFAWAIDRIGRNEEILMSFKNYLINHQVNLIIKNPNLQLLNSDGSVNAGMEIAFSLFATMAKQEMEQKKERLKRGKKRNKEEGKYNGGKLPFGFMVDKSGYIVQDPAAIEVVRRVFRDHAEGKTYPQLIEDAKMQGYKLTPPTLTRMFRREIYKDPTLGIVSADLWEKAKQVNDDVVEERYRQGANVYWAKRVIKCPHCNHAMRVDTARKSYKCEEHHIMLKIDIVDSICWYISKELYLKRLNNIDAEFKKRVIEKKDIMTNALINYNNELADLKKRLLKLEDDYYVNGSINEARFNMLHSSNLNKQQETLRRIEDVKMELEILDKSLQGSEVEITDLSNKSDKDIQEIITHELTIVIPHRISSNTIELDVLPKLISEPITIRINTRTRKILHSDIEINDDWYIQRFK